MAEACLTVIDYCVSDPHLVFDDPGGKNLGELKSVSDFLGHRIQRFHGRAGRERQAEKRNKGTGENVRENLL